MELEKKKQKRITWWDLGFDELFSDNSELRVASARERDDGDEMSGGALVGWF